MPAQTRLGDIGSGHGCHFPPTSAVEGSPNVIVNGKPAGRIGDAIDCGGAAATGSGDVFVDGE